jgi:hypothetical protein
LRGFLLLLSFLLSFKALVLDHLLPSFSPSPSLEIIPEATRISLVTSGDLKVLNSMNQVPVTVKWDRTIGGN